MTEVKLMTLSSDSKVNLAILEVKEVTEVNLVTVRSES